MTEDRVKSIRARRGIIKRQLTRFEQFLSDSQNVDKHIEITCRLDKVEALFQEFDELQTELELADASEGPERELFEDVYFALVSKAKSMLNTLQSSTQAVHQSDNLNTVPNSFTSQMSTGALKLPPISLPEFDGSYEKWVTFFDTFNAMINNNSQLSNVEKFYYLQASLKREAASVIESIEISDSNYHLAWNLLVDRFKNKKLVIRGHLKQIFELPNVTRDSYSALRNFTDNFLKHFRSLENLNEPVTSWSTILIYLLVSKLDMSSKREWEIQTKDIVSPSIEEFKTFLSDRCQLLESVQLKATKVYSNYAGNREGCIICQGDHYIYVCKKFLSLPVSARFKEVKRLKACTNCLRNDHSSPEVCKMGSCKFCNKKHNSLLHFQTYSKTSYEGNMIHNKNVMSNKNNDSHNSEIQNTTQAALHTESIIQQMNLEDHSNIIQASAASNNGTNQQALPLKSVTTHCNNGSFTILSTALVYIEDINGQLVLCRALLDSGSQSNFIVKDLKLKLQLNAEKINIPIVGINSSVSNVNSLIKTKIKSTVNNNEFKLQFLVIEKITDNIPQTTFDCSSLEIPDNVTLADPNFNQSAEIQILLGANIFYHLLLKSQINLGYKKPIIQNTKLGWIISGPFDNKLSLNYSQNCCHSLIDLSLEGLNKNLESFWAIEEIPHTKPYSREENECEVHFQKTHKRDKEGKFVLNLPFKDNYLQLGESLNTALKRFQSLEAKLTKNPLLKAKYIDFMREYQSLGHMYPISSTAEIDMLPNYYLPHHCVMKQSSLTTKYRVVFDASCKTTSNLSLNDVLKTGPCIQSSLISILLNFRIHNIVFTSDIAKMYRCVLVDEPDKVYQRILWRTEPSQPLIHFKLNTITYGTSSASFLATRCLKQLAVDNLILHPESARAIDKHFYMDDWLQGCSDIPSALSLIEQVSKILASAGFNLRQWTSNDEQLMDYFLSKEHSVSDQYVIKDSQDSKTLGILWKPKDDIFCYSIKIEEIPVLTKRKMLSVISQIFDPLGLIGPIIIRAKILLQRLWLSKVDWDDPIPNELYSSWNEFYRNLHFLSDMKIPRQFLIKNFVRVEIHCFSDASMAAYGGCLYLRSTDIDGNVLVRLACAKSRVAPLKTVTLPRLELCGALLAAKLYKGVIDSIDIKIDSTTFWSDSTIVLAWIANEPANLKQFVSNRVVQIQELTRSASWKHVPTESNPADLISRGCSPIESERLSTWLNGPEWLSQIPNKWPQSKFDLSMVEIPEIKLKTVTSLVSNHVNETNQFISRFSTMRKLLHITAYILRFKHNTLNRNQTRISGELSNFEIDNALILIVKLIQVECFRSEIDILNRGNNLPKNSKLLSLDPFLDENGLIRVGGRIGNSELAYQAKHPFIIPSKHHFTTLLIRDTHLKDLHAGPQTVLSNIRTRFWPLSGRRCVRDVLRKCVICYRVKPRDIVQKMGNLPRSRVTPSLPFMICGVDYAGPYTIKDSKLRNKKLIKAYICIFICFSTKAVHIEVVSDLSAEGFLNAFKRFVSRRGLCSEIYSDNAGNFVSANRQLSEIADFSKDPLFRSFLLDNHIEWHFIPPRSPHFGGLWESAVRLLKHHLKRIITSVNLTFEELYSITTQVEAIVNSRPLMRLTEDKDDLEMLTPGHFLVGRALRSLPEVPVDESRHTLVSRYRHMKLLIQHFWKAWCRDYLHSLQERTKWRQNTTPNVSEGDVVILKEENLPPMVWKMGIVRRTFPGEDGVVRVVEVNTSEGTFRRAVRKICVLPLRGDESEQ